MAVSADKENFIFPPPPQPDSVEWDGSPIGRSNIITRTKGRTARSDKDIDRSPDLRAGLLAAARETVELRRRDGRLHEHDVIVHGIRVRALTDSDHLINFWRDNWYSPEEWVGATGAVVAREPRVTVYAFGHVEDQEEAAYYSRELDTVIFFNTSYYGQLKSWVLGAVGRVLASEYGVHSIHGACVEVDGKGVLYIAPTGTGKSTSSYGLMTQPGARFHSDDWVYVHYTYRTRNGEPVSPISITTGSGESVRGYECFPWLSANRTSPARVTALRLNGETVTLGAQDLDLEAVPQAYAYISEKVFYLRTNIIESFPAAAPQILQSKLENVPDVGARFAMLHAETATPVVEEVLISGLSTSIDTQQAARLFAFDNSRAMLNIADVFGSESVYLNPMQPVCLEDVFLLKRDGDSDVVLEELSREKFMDRLILGITPAGKKEVAYNAYRAVNDAEERAFINDLAAQPGPIWPRLLRAASRPQSLEEEFTLFDTLFNATRCYDLNTILTRDPAVSGKAHAVDLTIQLIAAVIEHGAPNGVATLQNYRTLL